MYPTVAECQQCGELYEADAFPQKDNYEHDLCPYCFQDNEDDA